MAKYSTVIIGCGNIAGGYDNPGDKNILTHAHAINIHEKTSLSGVYDIVAQKGVDFAVKWDTKFYNSTRELFEKCNPDFVIIATPNKHHLSALKECLIYKPKAVICEKPLGHDFEQTKRIVDQYKRMNIPLVVNFSRRYDKSMVKMKEDIAANKYGEFINASAIYTKGILQNGSHLIDILRFLIGEINSFKVLDANIDYCKNDPTLDVFLKFRNGYKCHLIAGNEEKYSLFELDFLFSKYRVTVNRLGFKKRVNSVRQDPIFPNYKDLDDGITEDTGFNDYLINLIDNLINHIKKNELLLSSGKDGLQTQLYCKNILDSYKNSSS